MSGHVTSDRNYHEVDWTAWHPWTKDDQQPFASAATPKNKVSHLVRQYDQPVVSVIIPVGKGHEKEFLNALDSLDAQTYRRWEAIVIFSGAEFPDITKPEDDILPTSFDAIMRAYPYVRFYRCSKKGAGAARNMGAELARAKLLLFLDADDWLYPQAIEKMVAVYVDTGHIVYTDYVGKAYIDKVDALKLGDRLLEYNDSTQEAVIRHYSSEYDCERAVRQPDEVNKDTYIWCLITSLVEKKWHDEIGGFDESMESWEDWDYWIRMAQSGKCFARIAEDLVVYRFYTGARREAGLHGSQILLEYLISKKEAASIMPCGCGRNSSINAPSPVMRVVQTSRMERSMDGDNFVLVDYKPEGRGQRKIVGQATGTFYGYRDFGERFLVHKDDIAVRPDIFFPVPQEKPAPPAPKKVVKEAPEPEPAPSVAEFDAQSVPGVTPIIAASLSERGINSYKAMYDLGLEGLKKLNGCGPSRAAAIYKWLVEQHESGEF
jgi:glycosyltransferase involved in cell wall biosynthesis